VTGRAPARETAVWAALVLATLLSWWVGAAHGLPGDLGPRWAVPLLLLVAFVKIRLVGLHFMELRAAPRLLRGLFEGWVVLFAAATIVLSSR
jgi:caa(3)-type oxidase subunit IV